MGEKDPVSVEMVDLLIFSARPSVLTCLFCVSGDGSSMLTWMFHRFVSRSVVYNNDISVIIIF